MGRFDKQSYKIIIVLSLCYGKRIDTFLIPDKNIQGEPGREGIGGIAGRGGLRANRSLWKEGVVMDLEEKNRNSDCTLLHLFYALKEI